MSEKRCYTVQELQEILGVSRPTIYNLYAQAIPSLSQAQRLRKFSNQGRLSVDTVFAVLSEEKPNQKEQVKFMTEDIRKYFPKNYSNKDMQKTIIKLLENWQRKRERNAREER